jgi:hypothetical protein
MRIGRVALHLVWGMLALIGAAERLVAADKADKPPPNVVFILADDK